MAELAPKASPLAVMVVRLRRQVETPKVAREHRTNIKSAKVNLLKSAGRVLGFTPIIPALGKATLVKSRGQEIETILVNKVKPRLY